MLLGRTRVFGMGLAVALAASSRGSSWAPEPRSRCRKWTGCGCATRCASRVHVEGEEKPSPAAREWRSEDSLGTEVSGRHGSTTEQEGVLGRDAIRDWEGDERQANAYTRRAVRVWGAPVGTVWATAEDSRMGCEARQRDTEGAGRVMTKELGLSLKKTQLSGSKSHLSS